MNNTINQSIGMPPYNNDHDDALERLAQEALSSSDAFQEFAALLRHLDDLRKRAYLAAGAPFGHGPRGIELWYDHGQKTTLN